MRLVEIVSVPESRFIYHSGGHRQLLQRTITLAIMDKSPLSAKRCR
jgi:hypothetical protein